MALGQRPPLRAVPAGADGAAPIDPLAVARAAQGPTHPPATTGTGAAGNDPVEVLRSALADPTPAPAPSSRLDGGTIPRLVEQWRARHIEPPAPALAGAEYRTSNLPQVVLGVLFTVTVVAAVVALFSAASSGSGFLPVVILAAAAGLFWWALLGWAPTVVSLSEGHLEVSRGAHARRFDLRSPSTRVTLGSDTGSRRWRAVVSAPGESELVIRARQVQVRPFCEIVDSYRDAAVTPAPPATQP